ncbi:MAG TPA: WYL domain-containing protein [Acidimicrobiales bacterium]|nr:WYL domain-containing protein [Acidimicrobiales bacterium]
MERVDRLERLTDLVLVLLREGPARSLRQIAEEVPGYPERPEARRQAFERDKRTLRAEGVEITTEKIDGPEQIGYRIRPEDYYLPDLDLSADEQAALNLAVAGVHLGDPSGRDALWRLGLPAAPAVQPIADVPALAGLPVLYDALRTRATVTMQYRGETRNVDPARLVFRNGRWYLVAYDRDRDAPRVFRVDRIDGLPRAGAPGSTRLPEGFDVEGALPDDPWRFGDAEPVAVDVLVDGPMARLVVARDVDESDVVERRPDGAVVLRLEATNVRALVSWVLGLGAHAEVLGPPAVRAEVRSWLEATLAAPGASPGGIGAAP